MAKTVIWLVVWDLQAPTQHNRGQALEKQTFRLQNPTAAKSR